MVNLIQYTSQNMATKQYKKIDKKGHEEIWEWEETPELIAALKVLNKPREVVITDMPNA